MTIRFLGAGFSISAALVLALASAQPASAQSGAINNGCVRFDMPSPAGCYVTTHRDRVTKTVFFFETNNQCKARIKNCKNGKCGSFDVQMRRAENSTINPKWQAYKNFKSVKQAYTFTFSGKSLGAGVRQNMEFFIQNFDPDSGKTRNTITSYFTASADGC
ncbi:MAG: hypothetical protein JJ911_19720 [Rhizobiaceae bacterium]|nr:hypothetical protein [Rhizobiaceae bacterium]